jgi:hypothetical protein
MVASRTGFKLAPRSKTRWSPPVPTVDAVVRADGEDGAEATAASAGFNAGVAVMPYGGYGMPPMAYNQQVGGYYWPGQPKNCSVMMQCNLSL